MSMEKQCKRKMSPAQAEALEKAREASAKARAALAAPKSDSKESLVDTVRELKAVMETQFKMHQDAMDQIKILLEDVRSNLPKKLDLSYLDKG